MTTKYKKRHSTSLVISYDICITMQIKITMRCHYPLDWLGLKRLNIPSVCQYVEELELLEYTEDTNIK